MRIKKKKGAGKRVRPQEEARAGAMGVTGIKAKCVKKN